MNRTSQPPVSVSRWRIWSVFVLLGAVLGLLATKAGHLQVALGADLKELAERQYLRRLKVGAPRGNIYDHEGVPLAVSVPAWSVYAAPRDIDDPAALARQLGPLLGKSIDKLEHKLDSERAFAWLSRRVGPDVAEQVRSMDLEGIGLRQEARRYYPNRELAGQTLGLVSVDEEGLDGIERAYEEYLRGRSILVPGLRDNRGRRIVLADGIDLDVLEGDDVHLTLDARLQHVAERVLRDTLIRHQAKSALAIVMEPGSGAIRALANAPLFNPNSPGMSKSSARRNHALSDGVEPGSVFKIVSFAAALDAGVLSPSDRIFCEDGRFQIGKHVIRDAHKAGWLNAAEVFSQSSNIGTIKIAQRVGEKRFREVIQAFGFGEKPGLGLVGESGGRLPEQARWGDVRMATISFGHGLLVSPLQLASAVATVANGGVRVPPRILEKVTSPTGEVVKLPRSDTERRVIREEAAKTLATIMSGVVEEGGTGTLAAIRGVRVAGKTGTAEKVDPVTKRYSRELHLSSFVGFAPADDPAIVAVVMVDEPRGDTVFGGSVAGPAWRAIVEAALIEEGILTATALDADSPAAAASGQAFEGAGAARPAPASRMADTQIEDLDSAGPLPVGAPLPRSFLGLSARQALSVGEQQGLDVHLEGTGVVVKQEPGPKTPLLPGMHVRLWLAEGV